MSNYYQAKPNKPYHLSIGAVIVNDRNEYLVHYFEEYNQYDGFYRSMKETMEEGETIEKTLNRGLLEEFGVKGEIITFLGSLVTKDKWFGEINTPTVVQKTVLFFLVKITSQEKVDRDANDRESNSKIVWVDGEELQKSMKKKSKKYGIEEFDESEIIRRAMSYIKHLT